MEAFPLVVKLQRSLSEEKRDYEIVKEADSLSNYIVYERPLEIKAGDRINFRSDSSVTHAIVNILIEIDI